MADKEYIERGSIYRRVKERTNPYGKPTLDYESGVKVLDMIKQESAADVVEVVRCKDCKHWGGVTFGYICREWSGMTMKHYTKPTEFCCRGERKEQT